MTTLRIEPHPVTEQERSRALARVYALVLSRRAGKREQEAAQGAGEEDCAETTQVGEERSNSSGMLRER